MFRMLSLLLLFASTAMPANVQAEVYRPLSPWNIHYGEAACDLKRIFKGEKGEIQLQISQSFSLRGASFYLVMPPISKKRYWEEDVDFLIEETGAELQEKGYFLRIRDENLLIWQVYGFDIDFLENLPDNVTLRLKSKQYPEVALKLTGMQSIDDALDQCQRNLYDMFDLDYNQVEALSKLPRPKGNPGRWAMASDYPTEALRKDQEGLVRFMLEIDPDGQLEKCVILKSSGHQSLDDQTCKVLKKRAGFDPALDKDGEKAASTWISAVNWQIPK
ncbi:MAG: energy transducer TonB [Parasphingorhabdus sp.]|uniref:energy transducer TonB n=1 Tax=Parasphingorhabdus sp. TaxID=2709688 RepID=UPI00329842BD